MPDRRRAIFAKPGFPLLTQAADGFKALSKRAIGTMESWLLGHKKPGEGACRVVVAIRVRPALNRKIVRLGDVFHSCIGCSHKSNKIYISLLNKPVLINSLGKPVGDGDEIQEFQFNHIFSQSTSTAHIYTTCFSKSINELLNGRNITIIAYGQTSSGKTYTLLGNEKNPGLAMILARDLFACFRTDTSKIEIEVSISYCHVYKRNVSDLLELSEEDLELITNEELGVVEVNGLSRHIVRSDEDVRRLIEQAAKNRTETSARLNTTNSKSHAILTFHVLVRNPEALNEEEVEVNVAKLKIVDLAGSETVKIAGIKGENSLEVTNVNLSLVNLALVVKALNENKVPPYQHTVLTELLSNALGGNCVTTLIATISPAQWNAEESLNTLNFAEACSKVQNRVKIQLKSKLEMAFKTKKNKIWLSEKELAPWKDFQPTQKRICIENIYGKLSCLAYGDAKNPIVLCLHGRTSDAQSFYGHWLLPALAWSGHYAVALDMPNRGESKGIALKTRPEFCLNPNGAAEVVWSVMTKLVQNRNNQKICLVGYDWGGSIALSMACTAKYRKKLEKIVLFHPTYQEMNKDTLKRVEANTLIIWCKQNMLHSWSNWKFLAKILSDSLGRRKYKEYIFEEAKWAEYEWVRHNYEIERRIIKFLTGKDPVLQFTANQERHATSLTPINWKNANFSKSKKREIFKRKELETVAEFKRLFSMNQLCSVYKDFLSGGVAKQTAIGLLRDLPVLDIEFLKDPEKLVYFGLWSKIPKGWHSMQQTPRYFPGRRVLIKYSGICPLVDDRGFMQLNKNNVDGPEYTTWRAKISRCDDNVDFCKVEVETTGGLTEEVCIPRIDILKLNHPHDFPTLKGETHFQDELRCNYNSFLLRAKMCEIALHLSPIVSLIDFNAPKVAVCLQRACVQAIREALKFSIFSQKDLTERRSDRSRYCGNDVSRLAINGEGKSSVLTSVVAAFLKPWSPALGIDLMYRGGCRFVKGSGVEVSNSSEHHPWLEFAARPCMKMFTCDLLYEHSENDGRGCFLDAPVEETYDQILYPHGKLLVFNQHPITLASIKDTDFQSRAVI